MYNPNQFGYPDRPTTAVPSTPSFRIPRNSTQSEESQNEKILTFIGFLEGCKAKCKNLHWAACKMNIHKELDSLLDEIGEYQDSIAEDSMGIYGKMEPNAICPEDIDANNPCLFLEMLVSETIDFYKELEGDVLLSGIKSETETFIHTLNKEKYLFSLCDCCK